MILFMKIKLNYLLLPIALFAVSCELYETRALKNNISELFVQHKISVSEMDCRSNLRERSGICVFTAGREDISGLIESLKLKKSSISTKEKIEECKKSSLSRENGIVETFVNLEKLELKNGQAFEKFNLFYNQNTREGCVQIEYSYG